MSIYLDYNATTPVEPAVVDRMQRVLSDVYGNPSSTHRVGRKANAEVIRSRQEVAALLGAAPDEIVFTGGGSEANKLDRAKLAKPGNITLREVCEPQQAHVSVPRG